MYAGFLCRADLYFVVDIAINFRSAFISMDGIMVNTGPEIAKVNTHLCLSPACLPFDAAQMLAIGLGASENCSATGSLLHHIKSQAYFRGWFVLDVVSCLPTSYIVALVEPSNPKCESDYGAAGSLSTSDDSGGGSVKMLKVLRLLRLAKLLR